MALAANTRIGPYDVIAPIGAGGMGEVYRARDSRLSREVAVKILPASFASDADRLRRFEVEARATGALNHPNILQVHDVGTHEGAPYLVSELLEGETLRERIGGTALPVRKAIDLASQIARGLAAAHQKGIVHRDLKPDNVFVTTDGRVKILDFGLAKLAPGEALMEAETNTRGVPGTDAGTVLGTVGYMSPEQVRARPVDHRSDIFSFGSILYEMLSGRRAFRGASSIETMNAILKEDPPELSSANPQLPPALERIVRHCLEKHPDERFQSASDIAFGLDQLSGSGPQASLAAPRRVGRRSWWLLGAGAAVIAIAAAAYVAGRKSAAAPLPEFRMVSFQRGAIAKARFAPDGQSIVYGARWPDSDANIYVARPGSPESRSFGLPSAELWGISRGGEMAVGLERQGPGRTLARLPIDGGAPRDVADNILEADWAPDGSSLAVVRADRGTRRVEFPMGTTLHAGVFVNDMRVSPRGDLVAFADHPIAGDYRGDVAVVDRAGTKRTLSSGWADLRGLAWSPDGAEVWFTATRTGIELNLWSVDLEGRERQVYRAPGHMLIHDIAPDGRALLNLGRAIPSLIGRAPGEMRDRDLSWLDFGYATDLSSDGRTFLFAEQGDAVGGGYSTYVRGMDGSPPVLLGKGSALSLSPDGRLALVVTLTAPEHLAVLPTGVGAPRSLPTGTIAQFHWAAFFPDSRRIAIAGNERGRGTRIFVQDIEGGDPKPISPEGTTFRMGSPVTPDGAYVAARGDTGIALYPVAGGEPVPVKASGRDAPLRFGGGGRLLYVRRTPAGQGGRVPARIYRLDLVSGTEELWRELSPAGAPTIANVNSVAIAPDAGAYAYTYSVPTARLYEVRGLR
jgi:sugar lactone lactonase YvrE